jgi:hypothetical protein
MFRVLLSTTDASGKNCGKTSLLGAEWENVTPLSPSARQISCVTDANGVLRTTAHLRCHQKFDFPRIPRFKDDRGA